MMFRGLWQRRTPRRPTLALALGLMACFVLGLLPPAGRRPLKDAASMALRPGQRSAEWTRARVRVYKRAALRHLETAEKLAGAQRQLERLEQENHALRSQLEQLRRDQSETSKAEARHADPRRDLLQPKCVMAKTLGYQARSFLSRRGLLDVGSSGGVQPEALVLGIPAILDCGRDHRLESGQLVLSHGCVWGKVAEVGAHTSSVIGVTTIGYRDLIQLAGKAQATGEAPCGPQGILEGTGEPLARIRLVDVTAPVVVGEAVYAASPRGITERPVLYGHVVRLRRPVGAAYWEIWMRPAIETHQPQRVAVLSVELNTARLSQAAPKDTDSGQIDPSSTTRR